MNFWRNTINSRDEILEGWESIAREYGILDRDIRMEI